jgi:hypothetical protein
MYQRRTEVKNPIIPKILKAKVNECDYIVLAGDFNDKMTIHGTVGMNWAPTLNNNGKSTQSKGNHNLGKYTAGM